MHTEEPLLEEKSVRLASQGYLPNQKELITVAEKFDDKKYHLTPKANDTPSLIESDRLQCFSPPVNQKRGKTSELQIVQKPRINVSSINKANPSVRPKKISIQVPDLTNVDTEVL